jgi:hypothetical protein
VSLTDAPDIITLFDTKLKACASYPSGIETWYPEAPEGTTADHFVLVLPNSDQQSYAEGAAPLTTGEVAAVFFSSLSVGDLQQLAVDLSSEAILAPTGIRLRSGGAPIPSRTGRAKRAGGHSLNVMQITFQFGLTG